MDASYSVSEHLIVQERGMTCDLCTHSLRQGEVVFVLFNSMVVTDPVCSSCAERLTGESEATP